MLIVSAWIGASSVLIPLSCSRRKLEDHPVREWTVIRDAAIPTGGAMYVGQPKNACDDQRDLDAAHVPSLAGMDARAKVKIVCGIAIGAESSRIGEYGRVEHGRGRSEIHHLPSRERSTAWCSLSDHGSRLAMPNDD